MKYLHIEHNKYGTYVYFNDKKGKSTLFTVSDLSEECCIADENNPVNICIEVRDITCSANLHKAVELAKRRIAKS